MKPITNVRLLDDALANDAINELSSGFEQAPYLLKFTDGTNISF